MAFRELIDVAKELVETTKLPVPSDAASGNPRHANYHRLVVIGGCFFAAVAVLLIFALIYLGLSEATLKNSKEVRGVIVLPFLAGIAGFIFGMCVMCLFAPTEFLTGPIGERWMRKIGTTSVVGARAVCLIFALLIAVPVTWAAMAITQDENARAAKLAAAPPAVEKPAVPPKADPSPEQVAAEAAQKASALAMKADLIFSEPLIKALEQFGMCIALQESSKEGAASFIVESDLAPYVKTSLLGKSVAKNLPTVVRRLKQPDWDDLVHCVVLFCDKSPNISEVTSLLGTEDANTAPPGLPVDQLPPDLHPRNPAWHQFGRLWFATHDDKITTIVVDVQKH